MDGRFEAGGWNGLAVSGDTLYICYNGKFLYMDLTDKTIANYTPDEQNSGSSFLGCSGSASPKLVAYATPVVSGSIFYTGTYTGDVYALDAATGAKKWEYATEKHIVGGPAISGDALVIAAGDKLYKLNAKNGNLLWDEPFDTSGKIWSTPVISGSAVYFGNLAHKFYAVDLETGEEIWSKSFDGAIASTALIVEDTLYFGTFENKFYALDTATGEPRWVEPFKAENWFWTRAAFQDETIYVGSFNGIVYALDAAVGTKKWEYDTGTGDRLRAAPVIAGNVLVIGSQDDHIYGLNLQDGTEAWAPLLFENDIMSDPWVEGNTVYFLVKKEGVYAINAETRDQIWSDPLELD
jgi:outer membrane protein assembly factor BamB